MTAYPMNPQSILWPVYGATIIVTPDPPKPDIHRITPPTPPPPKRVREPRGTRPVVILNPKGDTRD